MVLVVKNLPANAGDIREAGSSPGLGRSPREEYGNLVQYSCLENPMDRGAWWATVHRVAESDTTETTYHTCMHTFINRFLKVISCLNNLLLFRVE